MLGSNILLTFFFILLPMFDHCKGTADMQNCTKHLSLFGEHNRSRTCSDGVNEMLICYPAVLSEGQYNRKGYYESDEDRVKLKPSRRFSIPPVNESKNPGICPSEEESHSYGEEFGNERHAFLDDYQQLFLDLVDHVTGWPGCGQRESHSFKLGSALRDGCTIAITAELLSKYQQNEEETRQFVIRLLQDYPEPIMGLENLLTMFTVSMTDKQIKLETRLWYKKVAYRHLFDRKKIELKIKVFGNKYVVLLDDHEYANIENRDHPFWAINYTYITGDLKPVGKNPIKMVCDKKKPAWNEPLIDWSNKLDDRKPTKLELLDLQFKGPTGAVHVYLLKGCPKFNMTVCLYAMEYKLSISVAMGNHFFELKNMVHRRRSPYHFGADGDNYTIGFLYKKIPKHLDKYNLNIGLDNNQEFGLKLQGDEWWNKTMAEMEDWQLYTHDYAEFVQVLTEGEVDVGDWQLHMAPSPMPSFNGDKTFEPGKTGPPWILEHKLTNVSIGDYIKVHFKFYEGAIQGSDAYMVLYRGYPGWTRIDDVGQTMLMLEITSGGEIRFRLSPFCEWTNIRKKICVHTKWLPSEPPFIPENVALFQANQEHVIHIKAYKNGFKVDVFDTKQKLLATYKPAVYIPYYTIEYFSVDDGNIILMEKPKFCKAGDKKC